MIHPPPALWAFTSRELTSSFSKGFFIEASFGQESKEASGTSSETQTVTGTVAAQSGQTSMVQSSLETSTPKSNAPRKSLAMLNAGTFLARTPPLDFDAAHRRFRKALGLDRECVCCHGQSGDRDVRLEASRTAFTWLDKTRPDPNAPILLCRPCAKMHHEEMDSAWADYRAGSL